MHETAALPSSSHSRPASPASLPRVARSGSSTARLSTLSHRRRASANPRSSDVAVGSQPGEVNLDWEHDRYFRAPAPAPATSASRPGDRASPKPGLSPIRTEFIIHPVRPKVRSYSPIHSPSPSSSSCNEAPESLAVTTNTSRRLLPAHARLPQAHQRPLDLPFAATNPVRPAKRTQVAHASPLSPLFPSPSFSLSSPSRPFHRPRTPDSHTPPSLTSQTSLSSLSSAQSSPRVPFPQPGFATPSPSPRSHRKTVSTSSTPSRRPPPSILRHALVPARGPPTLAMSMQIHAPSPIISSRAMSPPAHIRRESRSHSRPTTPLSPSTNLPPMTRPGMPRPPSRSERLLRDTLRKVEEQERLMMLTTLPSPSVFGAQQPAHGFMSPPPPGGRRSRRATSSSTTTDASLDAFAYCDTGACYSDDEDVYDNIGGAQWLARSSSRSSSSSGHRVPLTLPHSARPQPMLNRHHSDETDSRPREYAEGSGYASPSSPSPARMHLQRSGRSAPGGLRPSHASPQSASRSSIDAGRGQPLQAPHSAVLHSRLEGVLKGARDVERARSRERDNSGGSGGSNSIASSRNMSMDGEWFFAPGEQPIVSSPPSSGMDSPSMSKSRSRANTHSQHPNNHPLRSPRSTGAPLPAHIKMSPHHHAVDPLTPPPTPPFNARTAAAQCKAMDGYVSFANIEGLGVPGGEDADEDEDEAKRSGRWLKWFNLGQAKPVGRERSNSAVSR